MDWKELLGVLATLATVVVGAITLLNYMQEDNASAIPSIPQQQPNDTKVIVVARAVFNDNGGIYVLTWDNDLLPMNDSIVLR